MNDLMIGLRLFVLVKKLWSKILHVKNPGFSLKSQIPQISGDIFTCKID